MENVDSRPQAKDAQYLDAMNHSHRVLHTLTMLRRSMLPHFDRDAFLLLDDFSQALVNQVDRKRDPFSFMMNYRFAEGFQNPETRKIYTRTLKRWSNRKAVEEDFGFLLAYYVDDYRNWNTSVDQEREILRCIKAWMEKNDTYTLMSPSNEVPIPRQDQGYRIEFRPNAELSKHLATLDLNDQN